MTANHEETLRQRIAELESEERKIERVIKLAGVPIERKERPLHDWLAQILTVLLHERRR